MKIAVLTSSRADYGIYRPLLKKLYSDSFFNCSLIVFGTHLSETYGKSLNYILDDGYVPYVTLATAPQGDEPKDISAAIGHTISEFARFWSEQNFDLVFALGDRYEMFAAVIAGIPFNIKFAHLHGGEETAGAIDNVFRHSITLASHLHFVSLEAYKKRVIDICLLPENVYCTGALSLDNLNDTPLLDKKQFEEKFAITFNRPSVLITYHPETVHYDRNTIYIDELVKALTVLEAKYQLIITMPNADTKGNLIRKQLQQFALKFPRVHLVENFGTQGYFSCMSYAEFMLGNSSSGIIEAASFGKYVINIGDRQKGRITGINVLHCRNNAEEILSCAEKILQLPHPGNDNIYGNGNSAQQIIEILKSIHE
jgi:GDP/UDP-N,N'-diacetylbacillosamine 2-epimerase (hydrolysing)